jgi:hypothetical protein
MRERRPRRGRRSPVSTSAGLPCVDDNCRPGRLWPGLTRLPRLVARGYLAGVLGRSRSVAPFYDESAPRPSLVRDQFVILIDVLVHMSLTVVSVGTSCAPRSGRLPRPVLAVSPAVITGIGCLAGPLPCAALVTPLSLPTR